jgi:hypothetical protein
MLIRPATAAPGGTDVSFFPTVHRVEPKGRLRRESQDGAKESAQLCFPTLVRETKVMIEIAISLAAHDAVKTTLVSDWHALSPSAHKCRDAGTFSGDGWGQIAIWPAKVRLVRKSLSAVFLALAENGSAIAGLVADTGRGNGPLSILTCST